MAVVDQRKDDGALALVKIHSEEGKKPNVYIEGVVLTTSEHSALKEVSIIENRVYYGIKRKENGQVVRIPIYKGDLTATDDRLTDSELEKVNKGIQGKTTEKQEKHKAKMQKWHNHFKDDKK